MNLSKQFSIRKVIPYVTGVEKILFLVLCAGFALEELNFIHKNIAMPCFLGLTLLYALNITFQKFAHDHLETPVNFQEWMVLQVLPKYLWGSMAVSTLGFLWMGSHWSFGNPYKLLMLGFGAIILSAITIIWLVIIKSKYMNTLLPILIRAAVLLVINSLFLMEEGIL